MPHSLMRKTTLYALCTLGLVLASGLLFCIIMLQNRTVIRQLSTQVGVQANQTVSFSNDLRSSTNQILRRMHFAMFGMASETILTTLLVVVIVVRVRQRVVKPIKALCQAAHAVANGDFEQKVVVTSKDEIGHLQQAFNQMVDTLRNQHLMRKSFEDELAHVAFHDPISNLPNRALFMDRLQYALTRAQRHKDVVAVMFLDLDNFKVVNDSLGHQTGDLLLKAIAERLKACVRPDDAIARLGGDEFTILLEDIGSVEDAILIAERIQQRLQEPVTLGRHEVVTTASIGIAMSAPGNHADDLLRDADLGMYRAKNGGKARYAVFDQSMNMRAMERLELEADLRRALERKEFCVHYQPVVLLATGTIIGVEALVRWQHPERGLIPPLKFIPLAEETGLILPIGQWVLEEACHQVQAWQQQFPQHSPLFLSVNLSARQFQHPQLVDDIANVLRQTGLAPRSLELEITESIVMENGESTLGVLRQLKALGIQLAIDDFGTGYSSLAYLKRFPIDTLKIDRSFVDQLDHDAEDTAIVRAIVTLAQTLNLLVTGEGIETAAQSAHLRSLGCTQGQGYYFAKPATSATVTELLKQHHVLQVVDLDAVDTMPTFPTRVLA